MSLENKSFLEGKFQYKIMPYIYGIGAGIVILGALFKLMHWPFASAMLIIGLGAEAVIFFVSAFIPVHPDADWSKVYPQLAEDDDNYYEGAAPSSGSVSQDLDNMLATAGVDQDVIGRLGEGLNSLSSSVSKMSDLGDAAVATSEYTENVKKATGSLGDMSESYSKTAEAMSSMSAAAEDASEYHSQVQTITQNLSSLNALYEMELQDANGHLKAMNKFYSNLSTAMDNISDATKDSDEFRNQLHSLTENITSLNSVYGNMLTAMKS
ncbi:MAG: gliding motility protein GldL [Cyclobacteriaceae bacterium]